MRILQLSSEKAWRGGEQQIAYLLEELQQQQHELMVACRKGSAFENYCQKMQISYYSLPFRNSLDFASAIQLKKICKDWKPDLLHAHSSKSHGVAWLAGLMGNQVPLVLSRRVAFPIKKNFVNSLKYNHPCLKKVICVTEAVRQEVLPLIKEAKNTLVIHSGIDPANYEHQPGKEATAYFKEQFKLPPQSFLIGTTAAFTKEKDYPTFLKAAAMVLQELPAAPIIFLAIGEGVERAAIQQKAQDMGLSNKLVFTGFIPEVKKHLRELDIFFFTSKNEGLGSSILEAFGSKTAVVSTNAGGIPEIVQHEKTGLLAPIGDHQKLAKEIIRLYRQPRLRAQLAQQAFAFVKQFDKRITASKTLEVYRQIVDEEYVAP